MLRHGEYAFIRKVRHQQIDAGERGHVDGDRPVEQQSGDDIIMIDHIHIQDEKQSEEFTYICIFLNRLLS